MATIRNTKWSSPIRTTVHIRSKTTEEGNLPEPIRTSHDLAHSTGLPKPPGYNLEWPRVTPIQVTLITRPPNKASHQDLYPKLCRIPRIIHHCLQSHLA
ncbi:hypothetical protein DEO72_LG9g2048 [Vigna unguiculata]|uniref:Uncharacterized protein n=1 Tax=Vigna unguiculata TaxID=3917 RepID=A0A4D6MZT8_VIGUN|nr:hypothetical protein DEO72_LG9g2048 [Vigna unguiculata]